ncbi:MAG TPA: hypothetical protein VHE34_25770 [Puia sp.]|uniref:hypothetical protein n=1 Tax=Puia sp. TaxID=2045100 RepID=UPI002CB176EA|nr:hypothetical protein [Puia sp.]HVU98667.1 hypothetical protein [Puia sp.]
MTRHTRSKLFYRLVLVVFSLWAVTGVLAQQSNVPVIHFDPHSGVAQQAAPFDRSFFIVLPVDTTLELDELDAIDIYKVNRRDTSDQTRYTRIKHYAQMQLGNAYFVEDTPKVAGIKFLKFYVDRQMLPNTPFAVFLFVKLSNGYLDKFNHINQQIYDGDLAAAQSDFDEADADVSAKHSNIPIGWPISFKQYLQIFENSLRPLYDQLNAKDTVVENRLYSIAETIRGTGFKMSDLFECNCEKDFVAKELFADSTQFLIPLQTLLNVHDFIPDVSAGLNNIQEFEPFERLDMNEIQKRIENFKRLKKSLVNISYFFHLSSFADRFSDSVKRIVYNAVYDVLPVIEKRIKTMKDSYSAVRKRLNQIPQVFSAQLTYGGVSPTGEDLQTASGHYIIADFGLANSFTFVNNRGTYTLLPYLGVNFSFVAIDKSQPLNAIQNKRFLHHLSAVVGLTTSALTRQGTADLVKGLSAVGGIAYRCSRAFRVTFGGLVYRRDNANPLLPQRVTVGPMVALSLDLDLAKWFQDAKAKLF